MESIIFYKVSGNGKLEIIDSNAKILHHQRSIIIVDKQQNILWMVQGKNVKPKLKKITTKIIADLLKSDLKGFNTKKIGIKVQKQFVEDILSRDIKIPTSRKKLINGSIPPTPKIKKSNVKSHKLLGDMDVKGPQIDRFQIAYIPDNNISAFDSLDIGMSILSEVQLFFKGKIDAKELREKVNALIDTITMKS